MNASIAICTRNRAASLQKTLERLAQCCLAEAGAAELLLVDNGSTDETRRVFEAAAIDFPKRYFFEPQPGVARARNRALREFAGDALVFIDDDIMVNDRWLRELLKPLRAGSHQAALGYVTFPAHLDMGWLPRELYYTLAFVDEKVLAQGELKWNATANFAVARSALDGDLRFDVELGPGALGFAEDSLFAFQLQVLGRKIAVVPEAVVEHWLDEARLNRETMLESAQKMGRSDAYCHHHWLQHPPRGNLKLKWQRARWRLARTRFWEHLRKKWRGELPLAVQTYRRHYKEAYLAQLLRERRRAPNYDRCGTLKRRGEL